MVDGPVVVGAVVPMAVVLYPDDAYVSADGVVYARAMIRGHSVIVNPQTRVIVEVIS